MCSLWLFLHFAPPPPPEPSPDPCLSCCLICFLVFFLVVFVFSAVVFAFCPSPTPRTLPRPLLELLLELFLSFFEFLLSLPRFRLFQIEFFGLFFLSLFLVFANSWICGLCGRDQVLSLRSDAACPCSLRGHLLHCQQSFLKVTRQRQLPRYCCIVASRHLLFEDKHYELAACPGPRPGRNPGCSARV